PWPRWNGSSPGPGGIADRWPWPDGDFGRQRAARSVEDRPRRRILPRTSGQALHAAAGRAEDAVAVLQDADQQLRANQPARRIADAFLALGVAGDGAGAALAVAILVGAAVEDVAALLEIAADLGAGGLDVGLRVLAAERPGFGERRSGGQERGDE